MERIKKQHYVPQMYLENFTNADNRIWVYNRLTQKVYINSIRNVCTKRHLYETKSKSEDYVLYNNIENTFSKEEGKYANILKKFISICNDKKNHKALILNSTDKDER